MPYITDTVANKPRTVHRLDFCPVLYKARKQTGRPALRVTAESVKTWPPCPRCRLDPDPTAKRG